MGGTSTSLEGGCLCGAVRYVADSPPSGVEYCHCRMCQRVAGAAFANWLDFRARQITWTRGAPTEYASSEHIRRGFCNRCGSTLSYRHVEHPNLLGLALASLDQPEAWTPTHHIYEASAMPWLAEIHDLPWFEAERPRESSAE